jgi:hypothetical protein
MNTFMNRGNAPQYTEIAKEFGVRPDERKKLLHDLIQEWQCGFIPGQTLLLNLRHLTISRHNIA